MSTSQSMKIVMQVLEWKNRKGTWPKPQTEKECQMIRDAFTLVSSKLPHK